MKQKTKTKKKTAKQKKQKQKIIKLNNKDKILLISVITRVIG